MPGSKVKMKHGKYRLFVSNGFLPNGKQNRATKVVEASSDRAADKLLQEFYLEFCKRPPKINSKLSFESFSKIWMERHERFLSPNTQYGDLNILKNRLIPYFGSANVSKINAAQVIAFVDEINTHKERLDRRKGKLSAASIYAIFKLLRSMLNKAQEWGYIASNPCNEIPKDKIPKKIYDCPAIMEYEQLEKFLQKLFSLSENPTNTKHQLFLYLSLIDGGRRGEHVALTWDDIDFDQKTIIISKGTYEENGVTKVKTTKSGKFRVAYFDDFALELLKKHKMYQDKWLKKYNLTNPDQYVFLKTRIDRVEMPTRAMFGHWLTAFLKKNGMAHIGIHGFRRMAASYALCNHVPLTAVKDMLGHSDVATTNKYLRNLERARRDGVKTMSNVFQDMMKKDDKNNE